MKPAEHYLAAERLLANGEDSDAFAAAQGHAVLALVGLLACPADSQARVGLIKAVLDKS